MRSQATERNAAKLPFALNPPAREPETPAVTAEPEACDINAIVDVLRSWRKASVPPLVSVPPAIRFVAAELKATYRPSAEIAGESDPALPPAVAEPGVCDASAIAAPSTSFSKICVPVPVVVPVDTRSVALERKATNLPV